MAEPFTDRQLLREFIEHGSEPSFEALVQRHVDLVFATALRRLGDPGRAQEVTQNVFITLARKSARLAGEASLAGWLHKTALFEARQWWRGELRRQRREQTAAALGTTMKDDPSLLNSLAGVLDDGLLELRETDRQALMLRYFEDRSHREIGLLLGTGEDAVRKRIDKALSKLTEFFRRRGYAVAAVATTAAALRTAAQATPAGLSAVAAQAALSAAGTASATGLTLLLAKLMALTKTQITVACLALAAAPVAYQWHALNRARADLATRQSQLNQIRADLADADQAHATAAAQLARTERSLGTVLAGVDNQHALAARAKTNWYVWPANSDYLRVPKSLVNDLVLSESSVSERPGRKRDRFQDNVFSKSAVLDPVMAEVLGLSPGQTAQVEASAKTFAQDFKSLEQSHMFETNRAPSAYSVGGMTNSRTFVTAAFPAEGAALRDQLVANWSSQLGAERADVLAQQADRDFRSTFNGYGTLQKFQTLYWSGDSVGYGEGLFSPTDSNFTSSFCTSGPWNWAATNIVPDNLRAYLPAPAANLSIQPQVYQP